MPAGGGGGGWAKMNEDMAANRAKRQANARVRGEHVVGQRTSLPSGVTFGEIENFDGAVRTITGTSIFDPVLCELAYRWFCPPGGLVLDPSRGARCAASSRRSAGGAIPGLT